MSDTNWLQELADRIIKLQDELEAALPHLGNNPNVKEDYEKALQSVKDARDNIRRFIDVFHNEYH